MSGAEEKKYLETYSWIKVPKYKDDSSLSWEDRYKTFEKHHIEETTFLIQKVRDLIFQNKTTIQICDCCCSSNGIGVYHLCNIHSPGIIE